jgi:hypothetical protein
MIFSHVLDRLRQGAQLTPRLNGGGQGWYLIWPDTSLIGKVKGITVEKLIAEYLLAAPRDGVLYALPGQVRDHLAMIDFELARLAEFPAGTPALWVHKGKERTNQRLAVTVQGPISDSAGRVVAVQVYLATPDGGFKTIKPHRCIVAINCPGCDGRGIMGGTAAPATCRIQCPVCKGQRVVPRDALPTPAEIRWRLFPAELPDALEKARPVDRRPITQMLEGA